MTFDIDGVVFPAAALRQPDLEPLYTAASIDAHTGDLIVKVANLQSSARETELSLLDYTPISVDVYEMSGFQRDDSNTFAEPNKVAPRAYTEKAQSEMMWIFPAESMTILRFKQVSQ